MPIGELESFDRLDASMLARNCQSLPVFHPGMLDPVFGEAVIDGADRIGNCMGLI
jgi:hypothetical protein